MKPRERRGTGEQDLFRSRLDQIIDMKHALVKHALVKLARSIDWRFLVGKFGAVRRARQSAAADAADGGVIDPQATPMTSPTRFV